MNCKADLLVFFLESRAMRLSVSVGGSVGSSVGRLVGDVNVSAWDINVNEFGALSLVRTVAYLCI